ncbi:sensor histidine kinase [Spirillospora sp. NPDC048911]|uniref:sensor histidine kinase n=1 Tax=Spirillospora sp. NPDC048911 TaxID=3364527 RepID=UPI00371CD524
MDLDRWRPDRAADRRWRWVAVDVFVAYVSATIPVGPSDVTASVLHGPAVVRIAAVVWFVAIACRRFAPATALFGAATATVAVAVADHPLTNLSAATALSLTMVAQTRPRSASLQSMALPVVAALAGLAAESYQALALGAILHGGAWLAGDSGRSRWEAARAIREHEAERARADRRRVLSEERARLARELHDAVGHAVTVMVTHAGAARLALGDDRAEIRASLGQIEEVGRTAMDDLDQVLGLLEDGESLDLPVSVGRLVAGLPAHLRAGLTVDGDLEDVTDPVGRAVHRVVQESLTNVVRHASATTVRVRLSRTEEGIVIEVADDGTATGPPAPGRGLNGMRERVQRLGGTFQAGPGPAGGWRVDARIPGRLA